MHEHRKRHEDPTATGSRPRHSTARAAEAQRPVPAGAPRPDAVAALQRLIGNAAVGELLGRAGTERSEGAEQQSAAVRGVLRSPGRPLEDSVRGDMEARLGADFSDVRVHTGRAAHESAAAVSAEAYTSGSHIVFREGRYDPASAAGRTVLAHELTHVVQQRRGPVAGTDTGGGLAVSDPSDRFEREAERVARGVTTDGASEAVADGPDRPPGAVARAGAGLTVARLMSVDDFQGRTTVGTFQKRGSSIDLVERALAECHGGGAGADDFAARADRLENLVQAAEGYLAQSKSGRHGQVVQELLDECRPEAAIFRQLANAVGLANPLAKARALLTAQEAVLQRVQAAHLDFDSELAKANVHLQTPLLQAVNTLSDAEKSTLVGDDLDLLAGIQADPGAPQVTRDTLGDLLANRGIVNFTTGLPGTKLSEPGVAEKYTLRHMMAQPEGATGRLGSLAHELTHVDAGESFDNTQILLLLRQNLADAEITALAKERKARVDALRGLLAGDGTLTDDQKDLFASKLRYATDPSKGVGRYAANFKSKLDAATHQRLLEIEALSAPNSSTLVEYDTVVTQLLVYLHRWGVPQTDPLYTALTQLATELRNDRRAAAAGH
ncbi:eCIS core domain-containing protein [Streptomyces griseofuscus]|uniref:eCIS core domain-containing protein n=1 Tax=Streptomyces griseofuscus TaxID=146922 RepID=UPI003719CC3B